MRTKLTSVLNNCEQWTKNVHYLAWSIANDLHGPEERAELIARLADYKSHMDAYHAEMMAMISELHAQPQCLALDTIAFECQTCNHWFAVSARHEGRNGRFYCKECLE